MKTMPRAAVTTALVVLWVVGLSGCGAADGRGSWPLPNRDDASTRDDAASGIDRGNVGSLHVVWRFRIPTAPNESGALTATPVVSGGVVYVQDMKSNVYALDLATGKVRWRRLLDATNPGPNGLAVSGGRVYGATDAAGFALDARTGRFIWRRRLVTPQAQFVDMAPLVADGNVYLSAIGLVPTGRGVLYALDARTGAIRWKLRTIARPWSVPSEAGGGGAWYAPSSAGGDVFWGTTNPYPYGGTRALPNGAAFAGRALYTDSLLAVDRKTGALDWFDQVTPHDVRDYDFQVSPILGSAGGKSAIFGAGKAGLVIAWDRRTHERLWQSAVGVHRNDRGPLPRRRVSVCPGLLGGVETPMALAGGRLFVPVVDLCMLGSSIGYEPLDRVDVGERGRGELVALDAATGRRDWVLRLPQANFGCATVAGDVVFTATFDGKVYGVDTTTGRVLWHATLGAGVNSCPSVASKMLLVGAGLPLEDRHALELTAFAPGRT
jgi:outer membrane protein assembly factor BamB